MARAYLRLDPGFFDRKAIDQKYPPGAIAALIGALCHAEHQPQRGRFRDERVLRALLGPFAKWIPFLIEQRDLVHVGGVLYVDGWDEWQEGDWKVGERVKRIRNRAKAAETGPDVTPDVTVPVTPDVTVETVYNLSDGGRQSVIDSGSGKRKRVPSRSGTVRARNGAGPTLSKRELDAWSSFGPEWDAVKAAWIGRGLRLPPAGDSVDGDEQTQRAVLYQVLDARPTDVVRWIGEAPGTTSHDVVRHVLERWHDVRTEAGLDVPPTVLSAPSRAEAAESLATILERL